MAHVHVGTAVDMNARDLPAGYVKPTVATFSDFERKDTTVLTVVKSAVEDPTPATTFAAIVADVNTQATAIIAIDYDTARTVDSYSILRKVETNQQFGVSLYNDDANAYLCTVDIYSKATT